MGKTPSKRIYALCDRIIPPFTLTGTNDGRTYKETECLNTVIGKDKLSDYTVNIAFVGFTALKILWLRNNEPQNFEKINQIMLPEDYGFLLLDVKNKC